MELFIKLFTVYISAATELMTGVPVGLALGLDPITAGVATIAGGWTGGSFVVLVGTRLRALLVSRMNKGEKKGREKLLYRLWDRYGVIGLGLMAPLLTGVPLGAAIGLVLGASSTRLMFWLGVGTLVWSIGFTLAGILGLAGFRHLSHPR